jgi:hypothetical protein
VSLKKVMFTSHHLICTVVSSGTPNARAMMESLALTRTAEAVNNNRTASLQRTSQASTSRRPPGITPATIPSIVAFSTNYGPQATSANPSGGYGGQAKQSKENRAASGSKAKELSQPQVFSFCLMMMAYAVSLITQMDDMYHFSI